MVTWAGKGNAHNKVTWTTTTTTAAILGYDAAASFDLAMEAVARHDRLYLRDHEPVPGEPAELNEAGPAPPWPAPR